MDVSSRRDTRNRMVEAAVDGLQRRGVAGMSFTDVLAGSGAARGAIYHHFPGGKGQLVAEAAQRNGADVHSRLAALPGGSPRHVVEAFLATVRPVVEASTTGCGCAVAAVAVTTGDGQDEPLRLVAATAFTSWIEALAYRLLDAGLSAPHAKDLAATLVVVLEGALVLCRATGDLGPFDAAARTALALADTRPAEGPPGSR